MQTEILSFIIPTFNEEKNISNTLDMLKKHVPEGLKYEIIVVDHGSTDNTINLAKGSGVRVYKKIDGTVAGLRNFGATKAMGDIFIFIDADVILTEHWKHEIKSVVSSLRAGSRILTGSWVSVPEDASWLERYWFEPLQNITNTHINSGHMIVSQSQFDELAGFDEKLETGEDYDISMRAKLHGIQVVENYDLKAVHEGYPKSPWEFMRREYWHGKGDVISAKSIISSKVAVLSLVFITLHVALVISLLVTASLYITYACIFGIIFICLCSSYIKFKQELVYVRLVNTVVYYLYFLSRSASLANAIMKGRTKKRQR